MDIHTVYKITCLINNKIYIGYTSKKIEHRLKGHFKKAKYNKTNHKFSNAILKYGKINFIIESIFETNDKNIALEKEIYYIKIYDTIKKGYNLSTGGECGASGVKKKLTEEHKEKIRLASLNKKVSDETKKLISKNHADVSGNKNPFYNKKHSKETKLKIANRDYIKGEKHHFYGKPMISSFKEGKEHPRSQQITINGIEYGSLTLAAKALKMTRQKLKKTYLY